MGPSQKQVVKTVDAGSIWIRLGLNTDELRFGLDKAKYQLTEWRDETNKSSMDMARWGSAIAAQAAPFLAVAAAANYALDAAKKYQEEVQQFSYVTGMSTDQAQRWRAAAIATDTNFGSFTTTMENLNARITSNTADGEALRATFERIGVSVKDSNGNYVDADTLMKSLLTRFGEMNSAQEKDAVGKEIWGRGWASNAQMINESAEALKAYKEAAPGFTQADLDKVDEFKKRQAQFNEQLNVTVAVVGVDLIKALDRAKNGYDLFYAAQTLNGKKMDDALNESARLEASDQASARQKWESDNKDLLDKSGAGLSGKPKIFATMGKNGLQPSDAPVAKMLTDPFAGLSAQDAAIKNLKDYTIPALETKLKDLETSGTATYAEIAAASMDVIDAKQKLIELTTKETDAEKDQVNALTDSWKEYQDALKKTTDDKKKLFDLKADAAADLTAVGGDVSAARSIITSYQRSKRTLEATRSADETVLSASATEFNEIKAGKDLATIKGTSAYDVAQAKASGPLSGITITGNIYLNGDKSFEQYITAQRRQKGVRS